MHVASNVNSTNLLLAILFSDTGGLEFPEGAYAVAWGCRNRSFKYIACSGSNGMVLVGLADGQGEASMLNDGMYCFKCCNNIVYDIKWTLDGKLLTAGGDMVLRHIDTERQALMYAHKAHSGSIKSIDPHPQNADIVLTSGKDGCVAVWDLRAKYSNVAMQFAAHDIPFQGQYYNRKRSSGRSTPLSACAWLPDGDHYITAGQDGQARLWELRARSPSGVLKPFTEASGACFMTV